MPCILAVPLAVAVSFLLGMDDTEVIESFRTPAPTAAADLPAADADRPIRSGAEFVYGILSLIPDVELPLLQVLALVRVVVVVGR